MEMISIGLWFTLGITIIVLLGLACFLLDRMTGILSDGLEIIKEGLSI